MSQNPSRRSRYAVAAAVVAAVGVAAYLVFGPPRLTDPPPAVAEARLLFTGPDGDGPPPDDTLAAQAAILRSWGVVQHAARDASADRDVVALRARLTATPDPAAPRSVLVVRFTDPDPKAAEGALQAVIAGHEAFLQLARRSRWEQARRQAELAVDHAQTRLDYLTREADLRRPDEAVTRAAGLAVERLAALRVRRAEVEAARGWAERADKPAAARKAAEWAARLPAEARGQGDPVAAYLAALAALAAELAEIDAARDGLERLVREHRKTVADGDIRPFRAEIERHERELAAARATLARLGPEPGPGAFEVRVIDPPHLIR